MKLDGIYWPRYLVEITTLKPDWDFRAGKVIAYTHQEPCPLDPPRVLDLKK